MKYIIAIFIIWALGSFATFRAFGTSCIIPYALVTMALFALAVWLANRKKA